MSAKLTNAIARARKILLNRTVQGQDIQVDIVFVRAGQVIAPALPDGPEQLRFRIRECRRPERPPVVTRGRIKVTPPSKEKTI
jgi:hypothetical protein